jgi:pyridoxamine 5'-phosphate oxidase
MSESFVLAPWRSPLARALHRNRSQAHHRFFQLATVTPTGKPSNRTVVFRGFVDQSNACKIITDYRSEKIADLTAQNHAEIAWYFTKTREQFRLSGTIEIVTANCHESAFYAERKATWKSISDAARAQFSWAKPKEIRTDDPEQFLVSASPEIPVDNFVLLVFHPETVDHLELRGNPQNRYLYQLNHNNLWQMTEVNP